MTAQKSGIAVGSGTTQKVVRTRKKGKSAPRTGPPSLDIAEPEALTIGSPAIEREAPAIPETWSPERIGCPSCGCRDLREQRVEQGIDSLTVKGRCRHCGRMVTLRVRSETPKGIVCGRTHKGVTCESTEFEVGNTIRVRGKIQRRRICKKCGELKVTYES
jgi:hypothetical protein